MFVTENISLLNNNNNKKIIIIRVGVGALWLVEAAFNQHFGFLQKNQGALCTSTSIYEPHSVTSLCKSFNNARDEWRLQKSQFIVEFLFFREVSGQRSSGSEKILYVKLQRHIKLMMSVLFSSYCKSFIHFHFFSLTESFNLTSLRYTLLRSSLASCAIRATICPAVPITILYAHNRNRNISIRHH